MKDLNTPKKTDSRAKKANILTLTVVEDSIVDEQETIKGSIRKMEQKRTGIYRST